MLMWLQALPRFPATLAQPASEHGPSSILMALALGWLLPSCSPWPPLVPGCSCVLAWISVRLLPSCDPGRGTCRGLAQLIYCNRLWNLGPQHPSSQPRCYLQLEATRVSFEAGLDVATGPPWLIVGAWKIQCAILPSPSLCLQWCSCLAPFSSPFSHPRSNVVGFFWWGRGQLPLRSQHEVVFVPQHRKGWGKAAEVPWGDISCNFDFKAHWLISRYWNCNNNFVLIVIGGPRLRRGGLSYWWWLHFLWLSRLFPKYSWFNSCQK